LLLDQDPPVGKRDVAGYLYGIAAECALKELMRQAGIRPLPPEHRRDDPFYMHFPELKTALRDHVRARSHTALRRYAENSALMAEWDTTMRYGRGPDVLSKPVERWRNQALALVREMEGAL
jgi:hypothetical protein